LPGFMMFFGSSARLMVRIMLTAVILPADISRMQLFALPSV
jgi:hypothetical protein